MVLKTLFIVTLVSLSAYSHFKPVGPQFWVTFHPGQNYEKVRALRKQKGYGEHVQFLKDLYHKEKAVVTAGVFRDSEFWTLVLSAKSEEEVNRLLDKDPAVRNKRLRYEIRPFTVTMLPKHKH